VDPVEAPRSSAACASWILGGSLQAFDRHPRIVRIVPAYRVRPSATWYFSPPRHVRATDYAYGPPRLGTARNLATVRRPIELPRPLKRSSAAAI